MDPVNRLRNWCSSRYLRIPPLHREFHSPLSYSRNPVSDASSGLGPEIKHPTWIPVYAPLRPVIPNNTCPPRITAAAGMKLAGASSAGTFRPAETGVYSLPTEVYAPKCFIPHMALLRQGFPHCAKFPTAASRRSLGRISVPMWPITLSGRLPSSPWWAVNPPTS